MKAYPTYKDSGVQWISEVPDTWNIFPAKQLFADSKERRRKDDTFLTASQKYGVISQQRYMQLIGGRIVQASQDFDKWKHVEPDDFVISLRSFQGGLEMCTERGCVTWHYVVLKPKAEIIPLYFKWLFKSYLYIKSLQSTCNFIRDGQDLRYSNFVQVPIPVPSLDEQKAIASFLDKKCAEIDELVSRRQSIIERLKELKQSIIAEAVTKGLNPDVPMKDSGIAWIGDIPQHWEIRRFANEFLERRTKVSDQDYPPISVTKQGILPQLEKVAKTDNGDNRKLVRVGDFVINSRSDRKGSSGLSAYEGSVSLINHVLIPAPSWNRLFVHHLLRSVPFQEEFYKKGHGIVADLWTTRYSDIASSYIPFPPTDEQQAIAIYLDKKCSDIDELVARQEQIIEKLKELKTSTIAHVVTGKVDVRDAI